MKEFMNLQLFAEGDTSPEEVKGQDNKPEGKTARNPFSKLFNKDYTKEPEKKDDTETDEKPVDEKADKEPDKKPDTKPDVKKAGEEKADEKTEPEEPEKKEPEYDEIIYNKEKVKIPVTERQTYLQKGYNYDKVKATADRANEALIRAAKVEGFKTVDEYLKELEMREKALLAEKIDEAGGDPEVIDDIIRNHPEVVKTREERQRLEFEKIRNELKQDRFFKELEGLFDELMIANPTADPRLVYKVIRSDYLTPEKLKEIVAKEKESVEKKVLADVHDKERRTAPTGGDSADDKELAQPTEFSRKLAKIFGVSASKIAQRSHERMKGR